MVQKKSKLTDDMLALFEKDAREDTFINPRKIEHLETWRNMYNLTINDVREAIIEYADKLEPIIKKKRKGYKIGDDDNKGFDFTSFAIAKLVEDYINKNKGVSVTVAINNISRHLSKLFKMRSKSKERKRGFAQKDKSKWGWTIEQVRLIHKRVVKENPKIYQRWLRKRFEHLTQKELG